MLPALGVSIPTTELPIMLKCPLCQSNTLWVTNNDGLWAEWLYCSKCSKAGDLLEWSEAVLKLPLEQCLIKFAKLGILDNQKDFTAQLAEYRSVWPTIRSAAVRLIQLSRKQLEFPPHGNLKPLLSFTEEHWLDPDYTQRLCKYFGLISMEQLKTPESIPEVADTLVIPTYDLPGRYAGVLLVTLDPDAPPVLGYRSFPKLLGLKKYNVCAGAAFLPQAIEANKTKPYSAPEIVVYCDTVAAVKGLLRWAKSSSEPIPLVIPVQQSLQSSKTVWQSLPPTNLVFAGSLDSTLGYASSCGGQIALVHDYPFKNMKNTLVQMQKMRDDALPWQQVVVNRLMEVPGAQRTDVFMKMDINASSREAFINQVPLELKQQLTAPISEGNWRTFQFQWRSIVETANGWHLQNKKAITNGTIRIDRIVSSELSKTARAEGRVLLKGAIYPFELTMRSINDRGLFKTISNYLKEEHGCINFWYMKEWNSRSFDLAIAAYTPRVVKTIPTIGWSAAAQQFVFYSFTIGRDGSVNNNWVSSKHRKVSVIPTSTLPPPSINFPSDLIPPLEQTDSSSRANWMLAAAVLHNILAPYVGRPMTGITIAAYCPKKHKNSPLLYAANFLGCCIATTSDGGNERLYLKEKAADDNNWPIALRYCKAKQLLDLVAKEFAKKTMVAVPPATAATMGWLPVPEPAGYNIGNWPITLQHLLPHVLQFMLQQKLGPMAFSHELMFTYALLERWLLHIGASTAGLDAARDLYSLITTPEYAMVACAQNPAVFNAGLSYDMRTFPILNPYLFEKFESPKIVDSSKLFVFTHADHVFISKRNFESYRHNYIAAIPAGAVSGGCDGKLAPIKNPDDYYIYKLDKWVEACRTYTSLYTT